MLDEESKLPIVIGNLTPIAFVVHEEAIVFVNESLWSLHVFVPNMRATKYQTTISPTRKFFAT